MILLQSEELLEHTESIIHWDTQQHDLHIDLTVDEIRRFSAPGSLDFGGSEFKGAPFKVIEPQKQNPEDDYGWWNLNTGTYQAKFNERIDHLEDAVVVISPHPHARQAGITGGANMLSSEDDLSEITYNFHVPDTGCNIKENARFATLFILTK